MSGLTQAFQHLRGASPDADLTLATGETDAEETWSPDDTDDRPLRVLAAEDNEVNQLVLATLRQQFRVTPTIVSNDREAVDAWMAADWHLVLMDAQMPFMDGVEATRRIRNAAAKSGRPPTPIVGVTATSKPVVPRIKFEGSPARPG